MKKTSVTCRNKPTNDVIDSCLFIFAANVDEDFDGIDDACDPEITDPVLYEAHNGDASLGEDPAKLYLERNTLASSRTGIANDYTEPNSHWALVGSSQDTQTSGTFNRFVMLEDDNNPNVKIPTILMKGENNTCVALQAQDYLSPALSPNDPDYIARGFVKLNELPEGEECE